MSRSAATTKGPTASRPAQGDAAPSKARASVATLEVPIELRRSRNSVQVLSHAVTSHCERFGALAAAGIDHGAVARAWYGAPADELSVAALLTGQQAEHHLLTEGAEVLARLAVQAGRLREGEDAYLDTRSLGEADLEERAARSLEIFADYLEGRGSAWQIVAHPVFAVELWGERRYYEADYACLPVGERPCLRIGEKKTFYDFDGHTGQAAIASLRNQGAAYYACLIAALRRAGHPGAARAVEPRLDAVLRGPRLYLDWDVAARTAELLAVLEGGGAPGADGLALLGAGELGPDALERVPGRVGAHCAACALRVACQRISHGGRQLDVLSEPTARYLRAAGRLPRALELAAGAAPDGADEAALSSGLAAAARALGDLGWGAAPGSSALEKPAPARRPTS